MNVVDVVASEQACFQGRSVGHVLVVEDDPATALSLASILKRAGYTTVVCHSGTAALRNAERDAPAAAMVDVHLPDLNGLVLTQKLRERLGPQVPIIVVSGDTSMETLNALSYVGATFFFSKPVAPAVLLNRLADCIGSQPGG